MKIRHRVFIIFALFLFLQKANCLSQVIEQNVIASGSIQFASPFLSVSSTLGETFISTLTGGGLILTQGFQQPDYFPCSLQINGGLDTLYTCGDSLTLQADSGFSSYSWSSGQTTSSIVATFTGWYVCTVAKYGCSATDSIFVSIVKAEILQPDTSVCLGTSIMLDALGISSNSGYLITDIDGNNYPVVSIGNQVWMQKNIDVSRYRNGDIIPQVTNTAQITSMTTGAWCWYNNDSATYAASYGKLYNWYAVVDPRGLLPVGWKIPDEHDWNLLAKYLDSNADTSCVDCIQSSIAGGKMKAQVLWSLPNTGATNSSGFNGLPGGRTYGNSFFDNGNFGGWWNSSQYYININMIRTLDYSSSNLSKRQVYAYWCYSARGVLDTPLLLNNSYLWSNGATTPTITVNPTQTSTYYVTVSNGISSCTDSVTVTVLPGAIPYYADTDGDNYGDSLLGYFCVPPAGGLTDSSDCDGNNPLIYPGAPEVCNSIDDDCDGIPDDGLAPIIGAISGNSVQCIPLSSGSAFFSIAPVPGANSYFWLAPAGTNITSGQGTTGVTIAWNTAAAHDGIAAPLAVTVTGACGQLSSTKSIDIHLQISVPVRPSSISGPVKLCPGDTGVYSVAPVSRARTYTWNLPSGMQHISGQGTNIIQVIADQSYQGGAMGVSATNGCGTGPERLKTLYINTPSAPVAISGLASGLCEANGVVYSVPVQNGISSYLWTVPAGAQLVSGQGSNQVTVNFSAAFTSGNLTVQAFNACGPSSARSLALTAVPARPGTINGPLSLCPGAAGVPYSVGTVNGSTAYNWSVFTGAVIASGAGTKNITIDVPLTISTGNNITVSASNSCGTGLSRALNGISVISSACTRLSDDQGKSITVFPNPSNGLIRFQVEGEMPITIQVYDMLGKMILSAPWKSEIDVRHLPSGLYVLHASYAAGRNAYLKIEISH